MDKNNTEAHSPCAKFKYFQSTYFYYVTVVRTHSTMKTAKRSKTSVVKIKGEALTENGVSSAATCLSFSRLYFIVILL